MEGNRQKMGLAAQEAFNWGQFTHIWKDAIEYERGSRQMLETAFPVRPCTFSLPLCLHLHLFFLFPPSTPCSPPARCSRPPFRCAPAHAAPVILGLLLRLRLFSGCSCSCCQPCMMHAVL